MELIGALQQTYASPRIENPMRLSLQQNNKSFRHASGPRLWGCRIPVADQVLCLNIETHHQLCSSHKTFIGSTNLTRLTAFGFSAALATFFKLKADVFEAQSMCWLHSFEICHSVDAVKKSSTTIVRERLPSKKEHGSDKNQDTIQLLWMRQQERWFRLCSRLNGTTAKPQRKAA